MLGVVSVAPHSLRCPGLLLSPLVRICVKFPVCDGSVDVDEEELSDTPLAVRVVMCDERDEERESL